MIVSVKYSGTKYKHIYHYTSQYTTSNILKFACFVLHCDMSLWWWFIYWRNWSATAFFSMHHHVLYVAPVWSQEANKFTKKQKSTPTREPRNSLSKYSFY